MRESLFRQLCCGLENGFRIKSGMTNKDLLFQSERERAEGRGGYGGKPGFPSVRSPAKVAADGSHVAALLAMTNKDDQMKQLEGMCNGGKYM